MSVAATSLSDSLPSSIPKLDATGVNWAIFAVRFQDAVEAKGFWGHFDGSTPRSVIVSVTATDGTTTTAVEETRRSLIQPLCASIPSQPLWKDGMP